MLAAAQKQNDLAFKVRVNMNYDKATSALAAFADVHPDTVRDVLNGSKHVTLTALYALTSGVGLQLAVTATRTLDDSSAQVRTT